MSFILLDKPKNITSNAVLTKLKQDLNIKKMGHAGTLDPFATGLLIIGVDEDTKFLSYFLDNEKTYSGILKFGETTKSYDPDFPITEKKNVNIKLKDLEEVINKNFIGKINQIPPDISAIKVHGKRSYELSRQNKEINLKPKPRIIFSFKVVKEISKNTFSFIINASSGTYIRAIARDLGIKLNSPAMLLELRREKIGNINIKNSTKIDNPKLINYKKIINIKEIEVNKDLMKMFMDGKTIKLNNSNNILLIKNNDVLIMVEKEGNSKNYFKIKKRIK